MSVFPIIIIPAYQPTDAILQLVRQLSCKITESLADSLENKMPLPVRVIVVDDGSGQAYRKIFSEIARTPGCEVIHHWTNLGKGRALKSGFNAAMAYIEADTEIVGVLTCDADGQHTVSDLCRVAEVMLKAPEAMVLGCRDFSREGIPFRSRFGNRVSCVLYRFLCGVRVSDTQTGLRGLPRNFIPTACVIDGEGYEYETNMLIVANNVMEDFVEVPIETIYENNNESSHFNPLVDSIKIYVVLLKYTLSSMLATIIDYVVFIFAFNHGLSVLPATYLARSVAGLVNYKINKTVVFKYKSNNLKPFISYILLIIFSGAISAFAIEYLHNLFGGNVPVLKLIVETLLFFFNYYIQSTYIFRKYGMKAGRRRYGVF